MPTVQIRDATNKDLNFLSDPELAEIIRTILAEIDSLAIVNAHRSMVYLSMSTLEGILSNVLALNMKKIKAFASYPDKPTGGGKKKFGDLVLDDKIRIARQLGIIAPEFFDTFKKFKTFRNYIHPLAELKKKQPLDIGLGQIALGLLNHTLSKLERIRFVDERIWRVLSGTPVYTKSQKIIEFKAVRPIPTNSFIVTGDYVGSNLEVSFDLHMGAYHLFNFVFNYENDERYHMLRFETRPNEFSGILHCDHKYAWQLIEEYKSKWDIKTAQPNGVRIRIDSGNLRVYLNGDELLKGKQIPWDNQKSIGFFNEVSSVYISNLSLNTI